MITDDLVAQLPGLVQPALPPQELCKPQSDVAEEQRIADWDAWIILEGIMHFAQAFVCVFSLNEESFLFTGLSKPPHQRDDNRCTPNQAKTAMHACLNSDAQAWLTHQQFRMNLSQCPTMSKDTAVLLQDSHMIPMHDIQHV